MTIDEKLQHFYEVSIEEANWTPLPTTISIASPTCSKAFLTRKILKEAFVIAPKNPSASDAILLKVFPTLPML